MSLTPTFSIPQLTPDDRLWRIDWFGECRYPPSQRKSQPSIRIAISPLQCDPEDSDALQAANSTSLNNQRQAWLPVGILNLVRIGDIWHNGQCVHAPNYQIQKFEKLQIKKGTTDFIKAGLPINGVYLLPLKEHPWHVLQTQSYCLSLSLPDDNRIIIPCIELIRFYFGSSSRLLQLLFTRQISEDNFWKRKHLDESSGHLHLKLASGISGMSSTDLGRIALDRSAWNAARLIYDTCQAASVRGEPAYPYTIFPFNGETDLIASGKWISYGAKPDATFVVYKLLSCSHPFPFESLTYEIENSQKISARKHHSTSLGQDDQGRTSFINSFDTNSQTLTDTDPGKSKSKKEYWSRSNQRFPDLLNKQVWRERYDTADPPALIFMKGAAQDENVSVGEGSSSNGNTRSIDIGHVPTSTRLSELDPRQYRFVHDGVELAIKLAKLQAKNIMSKLITLPGYTHPVIPLPYLMDENGEIDPISLCNDGHGGERCRRGCFVEINENENTRCRVFIVEQADSTDMVRAINVRCFDLRRAVERLIEEMASRYICMPTIQ